MSANESVVAFLAQEARGLLGRLGRLRPFVSNMPMVPAAGISREALVAIEGFLASGRRGLRRMVEGFLSWMETPEGLAAGPAFAQRRFAALKMGFDAILADLDIFADVLTQRSEHGIGVWIAGLDDLAADALSPIAGRLRVPQMICYLDRERGGAIRRARTRLPSGGSNPVAVIRVPRERMVGSGIAASVVHEVGHQGTALLGTVVSLQHVLRERGQDGMSGGTRDSVSPWLFWERWICEILSDFWAVARLGITATLGLVGVVSLPSVFVFRPNVDDPHPMSWLRVRLSCAMGDRLYPHLQWRNFARLWSECYPLETQPVAVRAFVSRMEATMPELTALIAGHRPPSLDGSSLAEVLAEPRRSPASLAALHARWRRDPGAMHRAPPTLAFAVIGQASADGRISPEEESDLLAALLTHWAVHSALSTEAPRRDAGSRLKPERNDRRACLSLVTS